VAAKVFCFPLLFVASESRRVDFAGDPAAMAAGSGAALRFLPGVTADAAAVAAATVFLLYRAASAEEISA